MLLPLPLWQVNKTSSINNYVGIAMGHLFTTLSSGSVDYATVSVSTTIETVKVALPDR